MFESHWDLSHADKITSIANAITDVDEFESNEFIDWVGLGNCPLVTLICHLNPNTPPRAKEHFKTAEFLDELPKKVVRLRTILNAGVGDQLFDIFRAKEDGPTGKYRVIILGALAMHTGANIRDDDLHHLRILVPQIQYLDEYAFFYDSGLRSPGKAQFLAALDHYSPGTPRDFIEPRYVQTQRFGPCQ